MKEYIERESLRDEIRSLSMSITGLRCGKGVLNEYMKQYRESVLRIVDEQPTADVISVVRCNDCKHLNPEEKGEKKMPRYIDADKIIEHLNDEIEACGDCDVDFQPVTYGTRLGLEYSKSLVETAETADVVQIVRCVDRIHRDPEDKKCDCSFQARGGIFPMDDNDFCSYGEKVKI